MSHFNQDGTLNHPNNHRNHNTDDGIHLSNSLYRSQPHSNMTSGPPQHGPYAQSLHANHPNPPPMNMNNIIMQNANIKNAIPIANANVRKIMSQTIGEELEYATSVPQVRAFVSSVDNFCQTTESLASLGKSLYSSPSVVFVVDKAMRVILWNDRAVHLTGFSRAEVAGRNLLDLPGLVPRASTSHLQRMLQSCVGDLNTSTSHLGSSSLTAAHAAIEILFYHRDGQPLRLLCACSPLLANPAGPGMLVVAHDMQHAQYSSQPPRHLSTGLAETPALHLAQAEAVTSNVIIHTYIHTSIYEESS
jgi:PAS domain-containing protein